MVPARRHARDSHDPQAYYVGRDNVYLDGYAIAKATLRATVHGTILALVGFLAVPDTVDLALLGAACYAMVVLAMFARQAVITMDVNLLIVSCFAASYALYLAGVAVVDRFLGDASSTELLFESYAAPLIWARCFFVEHVCALLDYGLLGVPKLLAPSPTQLLREHDRAGASRPVMHGDEPRRAAHAQAAARTLVRTASARSNAALEPAATRRDETRRAIGQQLQRRPGARRPQRPAVKSSCSSQGVAVLGSWGGGLAGSVTSRQSTTTCANG